VEVLQKVTSLLKQS